MMKTRIKQVREAQKLTQEQFGQKIGLSRNFMWMLESGERDASDRTIRDICNAFGVSETWLRTGAGEMFAPRSREAELGELIAARLYNRPESFQTALITTLLRFDPDGPEWSALERIVENLKAETEKDREP